MLSWTLFYTSIFALEKSPTVDVVDPDGIIKSQVLQSSGEGLCFTLNGSDAQNTRARHFLEKNPQGYVQHIAFVCDDIFKYAETLKDAGYELLTQTENYYDDIQAKFGLSSEFCSDLKHRHLLYDEDDNGQFLHLYCHLQHTALFIEFVQRNQGYKGFGAANAPYRLAAQRRRER